MLRSAFPGDCSLRRAGEGAKSLTKRLPGRLQPCCGLVLVALCLAAAPACALTLEEVLARAARYNPDLRAARAAARAGHEGVALARSAWLPAVRLGLSGGATRTHRRPALITARTTRNQKALELSVSHNLYRSGQDTGTLLRALASVRQAHALVEDAEQTLLLRVVTAYLDTVRQARALELRRASLAFFEERSREIDAQFRIGDRTRVDQKQAAAEREVAVAEVTLAESGLETQRALFETLVGIPPDGLAEVALPAGLPSSAAEARRMAEAGHPAVRAAKHALRAAEHAVRAAKGAAGSRIDLQGSFSRNWVDTDPASLSEGSADEVFVGIQLSLPLYEGGASSARVREAKWLRAQKQDQLDAAIREALRRAADAWTRLVSARKHHAALTTAVAASEAALHSIRREADIGERTTREVLDAERFRVERQIAALSAKRNVIVHAHSLVAAVGGLTARRMSIDGVPDLQQEARDAARSIRPGLLSILED